MQEKHPSLGLQRIASHRYQPNQQTKWPSWVERLLERPDAAKVIRGLSPQEFYQAVRTIGVKDAGPFLRAATVEQITAAIDMDAWNKDSLRPAKIVEWLVALAALGPARIASVVESLDHELVVSCLHGFVRVYDLTEEEAAVEAEGHFYQSPDRFFAVDVLDPSEVPDGEALGDAFAIDRLLDTIYRADLELGRRVLSGIRWDAGAETEEAAYRFRSGRMADLGYLDYYEALALYQVLKPQSVHLHEKTAPPLPDGASVEQTEEIVPSFLRHTLFSEEDGAAFGRALAQLGRAKQEHLYQRLLVLVNRALSADRIDPGDLEGARQVILRTASYLSLGIEYLCRPTPESSHLTEEARALLALHNVDLSRMFRLGYSLTQKLAQLAQVLVQGGLCSLVPATDPASLLPSPHKEVMQLLLLPDTRPLYCGKLDPAGGANKDTSPRPFRTLSDIAKTASYLEEIRIQRDFLSQGLGVRTDNPLEVLAGCSPELAEIQLTDILGTMLANLLLGRPLALVPLNRRDLFDLRRALLGLHATGGEPSAAARTLCERTLRERLQERLGGQEPANTLWPESGTRPNFAGDFVEATLQRLAGGLFELPEKLKDDQVDLVPRVDGLILR